MFPLWTLALVLVAYLLGSVPSGVIVAQQTAGVDLSSHGSGNTGAANAYRALGWKGGALVLLADTLKGSLAVFLAHVALLPAFFLPLAKVTLGFFAILGHNYSVFRGFKGGKGIATTFGVVLALAPKVALLAGLLWLGMVGLTKYSSVGSLTAMAALPLLMALEGQSIVYILFGFVAAAFAFYRHRANIERLRRGEELKYNQKIR